MSEAPAVDRSPATKRSGAFDEVRLEHVGFSFPSAEGDLVAVEDVSFSIRRGEILCLIGPSGSGKSTLLNALGGFLQPSAGRIVVDGGAGYADLRRGVVFQDYALFPWRTALGNVAFALEARGVPASERDDLASAALAQVGLSDFAGYHPHRLSGGMRQRVAVARALAFDPDLLLMDEPFAALDEERREELQDLVVRIWRETRTSIVYVTHSIREAVFLADRVVALTPRPGRIRCDMPIDLPRPRDRIGDEFHAFVKKLTRTIRQPT